MGKLQSVGYLRPTVLFEWTAEDFNSFIEKIFLPKDKKNKLFHISKAYCFLKQK